MSQPASTITPEDIKSKLRDIQGEATEQVEGARNQLVAGGALVAPGPADRGLPAGPAGRQTGLRRHRGSTRLMLSWLWTPVLSKLFGETFAGDVAARGLTYLGENVRKSIDRDEVAVTTIRLRQGEQYTVVARPPATKAERKLAGSQAQLRARKRKLDTPTRSQLKAARRLERSQKQLDHRKPGKRRYRAGRRP